MSKSISRQIIELQYKPAAEMREIYNEIMPKKCAANSGVEFLRPRIAYRLQELAIGSLPEKNKNKLLQIANSNGDSLSKPHSELMTGTKICREWNGTMYEVMVLKDCFEFDGQKFKSLSSIARKITGTRWNGPKFFRFKQ